MTTDKKQRATRKKLSENGNSELYDSDFEMWWHQHGAKFPDVPKERARLLWTAGYDDGAEWGKETMRSYD